jgi:hypothetical protein
MHMPDSIANAVLQLQGHNCCGGIQKLGQGNAPVQGRPLLAARPMVSAGTEENKKHSTEVPCAEPTAQLFTSGKAFRAAFVSHRAAYRAPVPDDNPQLGLGHDRRRKTLHRLCVHTDSRSKSPSTLDHMHTLRAVSHARTSSEKNLGGARCLRHFHQIMPGVEDVHFSYFFNKRAAHGQFR